MDLTKITIENFKCFKSKTEIELGKLTLLTGANSSGKSSIIYSVLGAIQSGEFPFQFSTNGKYVNMGDFSEIVYNHNKRAEIKLGFTFANGAIHQIETVWKEDLSNNLPKLTGLKALSDYFELSIKYSKKKYIVDFKYNPENDPQNKLMSPDIYRKFLSNMTDLLDNAKPKKSKENKVENNDKEFSKLFDEMTKSQDVKGLEIEELSFGKNILFNDGNLKLQQIFDTISKLFNSYDRNLNFISSFRLHPDRGYLETSKADLKISNDGKGYLDQIMSWETKKSKKLFDLIKILKKLNLLEELQPKRTEGGKFDLLVKTKKDGIFTSLYDVGFGISQFLPIVVSDLQLPKSSTMYIAQPEIHLHPSIQSSFGDYLIEQVKTQSKNYVIETHSEYLLNKIRLGIVKGEINESDVKIIFVDNHLSETTTHKISFNKLGQILNAPDNFFKTYMMDTMEIAINAAN
jgi:predicted ATPase